MSDDIRVTRNDDRQRYEITVDGVEAGFTEFIPRSDGRWEFPHTEIDPAFGGRGLGSTLVGQALADAAEQGKTVVPTCEFVVKYLKNNDVPGLSVEPEANAAGGAEAPDAAADGASGRS